MKKGRSALRGEEGREERVKAKVKIGESEDRRE